MSEQKTEPKPAPKIPVVETQKPTTTAKMILEGILARDTIVQEDVKAEADKLVWAYSCERKKGHVGIIFTANPNGRTEFGPGDWFAIYHDPEKPHDFGLDDLICQECFMRTGERVLLRVGPAPTPVRGGGVHFRIAETWMSRFAHSIPRADLEKWSAQPGRQPAATR